MDEIKNRIREERFKELAKDIFAVTRNDNLSRAIASYLVAEGYQKVPEGYVVIEKNCYDFMESQM